MTLLLGCSFTKSVKTQDDRSDRLSIMQGPTTENSTVINFLLPETFTYTVSILNPHKVEHKSYSTKVFKQKMSKWKVVELRIKELKASVDYKITVSIKNKYLRYSDTRVFSTFNKKDYKVFMASCMSDNYIDIAKKAWSTVEKKNVDLIFLLGDTVYADSYNRRYLGIPVTNKLELWSRFIDSRNTLGLYKFDRLVPVYAVWDDHDYGKGDGDRSYVLKKYSQKNFRKFFPAYTSSNLSLGKGVSFKLKHDQNIFYFLDNRSFRGVDKNDAAHLGSTQLSWLEKGIEETDSINSWFIMGDQFFGEYHSFDSYEGKHPVEFNKFIRIVTKKAKRPFFISGDRHLYESMKIKDKKTGLSAYEFTTSSFHAKLFPNKGRHLKNPRRIKIIDDQYNGIILEIGNKNELTAINEKGDILEKVNLD